MFREHVRDAIWQASAILDKVDKGLSNSYSGVASSKNDRAVRKVRSSLRKALEALRSPNWIGSIKDLPR